MYEIVGNTTATPNPRPDWNQTDETKADYIKNKPLEKGEGKYAIQQVGSEAIGDYSFARGSGYVDTLIGGAQTTSNKAIGIGSTAEGAGTEAYGYGSHAEGAVGKVTVEDDSPYRPTVAKQRGAHAEGCGTLADGKGAHSEGYATESLEEGAHSEGKRTKATDVAAHAEGSGTEAQGYASHAEGIKGIAIGDHSHVEGADGVAEGKNSHVEGWSCKTGKNAGASHAGGEGAEASAYGAFSHGAWTRATSKYQAVFGTANEENEEALFIVGNGELDENDEPINRSNALELISDSEGVRLVVGGCKVLNSDDIEDIVAEVLAALPKAEGVDF